MAVIGMPGSNASHTSGSVRHHLTRETVDANHARCIDGRHLANRLHGLDSRADVRASRTGIHDALPTLDGVPKEQVVLEGRRLGVSKTQHVAV
ncbi:MAG TPA: hypothetical protein VGM82_22275 [Gemmatimonadaceae bacterium]|jgi:hypothetical protein